MLSSLPSSSSLSSFLAVAVADAVLKYALSATRSKREAARFLGIQENNFNVLLRKYNIESYFEEGVDTATGK